MPRVSGLSVARWAHAAGFRNTAHRETLTVAVAIARGESGWNTSARNHSNIEDSRGLWQINVWAHPWGRNINLYNGQINAKAAWRVYRQAGSSFRPWTVYTRGIYLQHMSAARHAVTQLTGQPAIQEPGEFRPSGAFNYHSIIRKAASRGRDVGGSMRAQQKLIRRYTGG